MKSFPKTLNSWKDVVYVVNNYPKAQWQPKLEALIAEEIVKAWYWVKVLNPKEEGITDDTHKVVAQEVQETAADGSVAKKTQYIQYELQYNLTCKLARMKKCKTDEALIAAIAEVKALLGDEPETEPEATAAGEAEPKTETAGTTEATATPVPEATMATATASKTTKTKK